MLSDTIKNLRKKKGMSQTQIAIKLGITQGAVSQWETGQTEPASDQLLALAKIFGVSVYEIKGEDEPQTKKEPASSGGQDEKLLDLYSRLTPENRIRIASYLEGLLASQDN